MDRQAELFVEGAVVLIRARFIRLDTRRRRKEPGPAGRAPARTSTRTFASISLREGRRTMALRRAPVPHRRRFRFIQRYSTPAPIVLRHESILIRSDAEFAPGGCVGGGPRRRALGPCLRPWQNAGRRREPGTEGSAAQPQTSTISQGLRLTIRPREKAFRSLRTPGWAAPAGRCGRL